MGSDRYRSSCRSVVNVVATLEDVGINRVAAVPASTAKEEAVIHVTPTTRITREQERTLLIPGNCTMPPADTPMHHHPNHPNHPNQSNQSNRPNHHHFNSNRHHHHKRPQWCNTHPMPHHKPNHQPVVGNVPLSSMIFSTNLKVPNGPTLKYKCVDQKVQPRSVNTTTHALKKYCSTSWL